MSEQARPSAAIQPAPVADENQLIAERREKLKALRDAQAQGKGAVFPNDFKPADHAGELHRLHGGKESGDLEAAAILATVGGRMMLKRVMGKACFATLQDESGRIQIYVTQDAVGAETLAAFKHWDLGDILGCTGTLFKTKTGELSIKVSAIRLLTKSLRPLPDKFHGMTDQEQKYRQRYVDLIMDETARARFTARSKVLSSIRQFMVEHGFMEVETPMLHPIPGGANARPFVTHHNALDQQMFLRIAPELYLKRLIVGGFERVFEINRSFRNEGISVRHNPEFTMMEFYAAYKEYHWLMDYTEKLLRTVAEKTIGTAVIQYQGHTIDLTKPFDRLTAKEAVLKYAPQYTAEQLEDKDFMQEELKRLGEPAKADAGAGALQLAIFEAVAESKLIQPTYIIDYPVEISPLARASDKVPGRDHTHLCAAAGAAGRPSSAIYVASKRACRVAVVTMPRPVGHWCDASATIVVPSDRSIS